MLKCPPDVFSTLKSCRPPNDIVSFFGPRLKKKSLLIPGLLSGEDSPHAPVRRTRCWACPSHAGWRRGTESCCCRRRACTVCCLPTWSRLRGWSWRQNERGESRSLARHGPAHRPLLGVSSRKDVPRWHTQSQDTPTNWSHKPKKTIFRYRHGRIRYNILFIILSIAVYNFI